MKAWGYIFLAGLPVALFCDQSTSTKNEPPPVDDPCYFERYLHDPKTPALAKKIFKGQDWSLNNAHVSDYIDSLAKNYDKPPGLFYFKVLALSYKKADGGYAEELGVFGKRFVENNTNVFTGYFKHNKCINDQDLKAWAGIVILEISLLNSEPEDSVLRRSGRPINDYIRELNKNCKNCSEEQKKVLYKFAPLLKQKWDEYVRLADE